MVTYEGSVESSWSQAEAFAYLSDFSTAQEWDPGTVESTRLDGGGLREGARFKVVARFLGRRSELEYRMVYYSPNHSFALRGENRTATSDDRITIAAVGKGSRVTYRADLRFHGLSQLAQPLLRLAFKRMGDKALNGLREVLEGQPPRTPQLANAQP